MGAEQYPFVRLLPAADFRDHVFLIIRAIDAPLILFGVHVHARIAKCRDGPRRLPAPLQGFCSRLRDSHLSVGEDFPRAEIHPAH